MSFDTVQLPERVCQAFVLELKSSANVNSRELEQIGLEAIITRAYERAVKQFTIFVVIWLAIVISNWLLMGFITPPNRPQYGLILAGAINLTTLQLPFVPYQRMTKVGFLLSQYRILKSLFVD